MLKKKLFPLYNTAMERLIRASRFSKNEEAQFRLKVIEFSNKYGVIRRRKENEYKESGKNVLLNNL